jgi:predicted RNase H-like HicB family nuclease
MDAGFWHPCQNDSVFIARFLQMDYSVVFHRNDDGVSVSVPCLPGCWSEGDSEEEALCNIQDAIQDYLAAIQTLSAELKKAGFSIMWQGKSIRS